MPNEEFEKFKKTLLSPVGDDVFLSRPHSENPLTDTCYLKCSRELTKYLAVYLYRFKDDFEVRGLELRNVDRSFSFEGGYKVNVVDKESPTDWSFELRWKEEGDGFMGHGGGPIWPVGRRESDIASFIYHLRQNLAGYLTDEWRKCIEECLTKLPST